MFLDSTEMDVQLVEVLQQGAEGGAFGHLGEGVNILGETLATVAVLAVWSWDVGVGVVDVARKQHTGMHLAPVGSHLLAVLTAGVEISYLISTEDIVHILGELGLEGSHDGELLADEDAGEQALLTSQSTAQVLF